MADIKDTKNDPKVDVKDKDKNDTLLEKRAADKAEAEHGGALTGAQAVAAAVNKVAAAAVEEVQKSAKRGDRVDFLASGSPGGKVRLVGKGGNVGFGSSGTVMLNGSALFTESWSTTAIEGRLPADAKSGVLEVVVDEDTVRRGYLDV